MANPNQFCRIEASADIVVVEMLLTSDAVIETRYAKQTPSILILEV